MHVYKHVCISPGQELTRSNYAHCSGMGNTEQIVDLLHTKLKPARNSIESRTVSAQSRRDAASQHFQIWISEPSRLPMLKPGARQVQEDCAQRLDGMVGPVAEPHRLLCLLHPRIRVLPPGSQMWSTSRTGSSSMVGAIVSIALRSAPLGEVNKFINRQVSMRRPR